MEHRIKLSTLLANLGGMLETDKEIIFRIGEDKHQEMNVESIQKYLAENNIYPLGIYGEQELVETFTNSEDKEDFYKFIDLEDLIDIGSDWYLNDDTDELFADMVDAELSISTAPNKAIKGFVRENYSELVEHLGTAEEYISYVLGADSEDGVDIGRAIELQKHLNDLIADSYDKSIK